MSNAFYNSAKHDIPAGSMPWVSGLFKATLVSNAYTFDPTHTTRADVLADILAGVTDQTLTGATDSALGVCAANSVTFAGVGGAQTAKAVVIYQDLGGGVTRLMAYYDTGTGFPLTTTGANITVDWNNTPVAGTVFTVS